MDFNRFRKLLYLLLKVIILSYILVSCAAPSDKKAQPADRFTPGGSANVSLGKCIITGPHWDPGKPRAGVLYTADLDNGRGAVLGVFDDTQVRAAAVDPEWRFLVTGNLRLSVQEGVIRVYNLERGLPELFLEKVVGVFTHFTVLYDVDEGAFYIGAASLNDWSYSQKRGFEEEYVRGRTVVFRYEPGGEVLEECGYIDYSAELLPGVFGDEITVIFSPYPKTYAMGFFDKVAREFYTPSGYGRLIPSNCIWFSDPERTGSSAYEREVYPTRYYFFHNTGTPGGWIVYLYFDKKGRVPDSVKLGDSIWPPILYSYRNGTLVYLSTFPKSPTVSSRGLRITAKFLDDGTERSYALPPSRALEEFLLRPFALLYVD
jgi:hypothetical protein